MHQLATENPFPSVPHHESPELYLSRRSRPRVLALAEGVFRAAGLRISPYGRRVAAASGLTTYRQEAVDPDRDPGHAEVVVLDRDDESLPELGKLCETVRDLAAGDGGRATSRCSRRPTTPSSPGGGGPRGRRRARAFLQQPRRPGPASGGRGPRPPRLPGLAARRPRVRGLPARQPVRRLGRPGVPRPRPRRRAAVPVREPRTPPPVQGVPARVPRCLVVLRRAVPGHGLPSPVRPREPRARLLRRLRRAARRGGGLRAPARGGEGVRRLGPEQPARLPRLRARGGRRGVGHRRPAGHRRGAGDDRAQGQGPRLPRGGAAAVRAGIPGQPLDRGPRRRRHRAGARERGARESRPPVAADPGRREGPVLGRAPQRALRGPDPGQARNVRDRRPGRPQPLPLRPAAGRAVPGGRREGPRARRGAARGEDVADRTRGGAAARR